MSGMLKSAAQGNGRKTAIWLMLLSYLLFGPMGQGGFALVVATAGHIAVEAIPHHHAHPVESSASLDHAGPASTAQSVEAKLLSDTPAHPPYDAVFSSSIKPEQSAGVSRGSKPVDGDFARGCDARQRSLVLPTIRAGPYQDSCHNAPSFLVAHRTVVLLI